MKTRILLVLVAVVVAGALSTPVTRAHHYLYQAERPSCQNYSPDSPLTDNCVMVWWWWGQLVYWWADPSADWGTFIEQVRTATTNWENSIPQLGLMEVGTSTPADIRFWLSPDPCGVGTPACYISSSYENRSPPNGNENASYRKSAEIYINSNTNWLQPQYRTVAIAHELGHIYGPGEAYNEDTGACDPDVSSIMDGNNTVWEGGVAKVAPCDILYSPSALDVRRAKAFWGGWESLTPNNLKRSETLPTAVGQGTWIITPWVDFAWADQVHQMDWYWSYSSGGPFNNWYRGETVTNDIGVHFYTQPRTIRRDVNRTDYPSVPANSWSIVCGKTWSVPFQQWSNTRCSNAVQLS